MQVFCCIGYVSFLALAIPIFVLAGETMGWWQLAPFFEDFLAYTFVFGLFLGLIGAMLIALARNN